MRFSGICADGVNHARRIAHLSAPRSPIRRSANQTASGWRRKASVRGVGFVCTNAVAEGSTARHFKKCARCRASSSTSNRSSCQSAHLILPSRRKNPKRATRKQRTQECRGGQTQSSRASAEKGESRKCTAPQSVGQSDAKASAAAEKEETRKNCENSAAVHSLHLPDLHSGCLD